jgi:magnesium transporter
MNTNTKIKPLEFVINTVQDGNENELEFFVKTMSNADKARLIESLPKQFRSQVWSRIQVKDKGETLLAMHSEVRRWIVDIADKEELVSSLSYMQMDELADLDEDLPISVLSAMVEAMDNQRRILYDTVKVYPNDTAGGLMDLDAIGIRADVSIRAVLGHIRNLFKQEKKLPEHLDSLIVVDRLNRVEGSIALSQLLCFPAKTSISEVMEYRTPSITARMSAKNVVRIFEDNDLLSAPVVDDNRVLIGRITVDDVVDFNHKQVEKEALNQAGLDENADIFTPILSGSLKRAIWLGINLITAFLAAWIIGLYDASIEKLVALAILMPVVASMGGVTGSQTLTIVTRGVALEKISVSNILAVSIHELKIATLNGILWAGVVFVIAYFWFNDVWLGLIFSASLLIAILSGTIFGAMIPLFLIRFGSDPAIAGGVILTTITDMVGFFVFLSLATFFLI